MSSEAIDIKVVLAALVKKEAEALARKRDEQEEFWSAKYTKLALILPLVEQAAAASPPELVTCKHNELMGFVRLTLDDLRWSKCEYTIEPSTGFTGPEDGYSIRKVETTRGGSFKEDWSAFITPENVLEYCLVEIAKFIAKAQDGHELL